MSRQHPPTSKQRTQRFSTSPPPRSVCPAGAVHHSQEGGQDSVVKVASQTLVALVVAFDPQVIPRAHPSEDPSPRRHGDQARRLGVIPLGNHVFVKSDSLAVQRITKPLDPAFEGGLLFRKLR